MKRTLIISAIAGTLLLASAGAANADGLWFNVHIGSPFFGERHHAPPRFVVGQHEHRRHRPTFYRNWEQPRQHGWAHGQHQAQQWRAYRFQRNR